MNKRYLMNWRPRLSKRRLKPTSHFLTNILIKFLCFHFRILVSVCCAQWLKCFARHGTNYEKYLRRPYMASALCARNICIAMPVLVWTQCVQRPRCWSVGLLANVLISSEVCQSSKPSQPVSIWVGLHTITLFIWHLWQTFLQYALISPLIHQRNLWAQHTVRQRIILRAMFIHTHHHCLIFIRTSG